MERKLATIEVITDVQPIPNADLIVKSKVRNWWVVTGKDQFEIGDRCIYFEIDSLLPADNPLFEGLGKYNSIKSMIVDGKEIIGYRIRTVKLRGQISQGLAIPYSGDLQQGTDVTSELGVVKYDPYVEQVRVRLQSDNGAEGLFPSFIPKTDEERIQNLSEIDIINKTYTITEKIDGTSFTAYKYNNEFKVCSRNLILREDYSSIYWEIARKYNVASFLTDGYAIQGEIVGPGIQSNPLKLKEQQLFIFSVFDIHNQMYCNNIFSEFIENVPILDESFTPEQDLTIEQLVNKYDGFKSTVNPNAQGEGVVFRCIIGGQKHGFKVINNKYLLKEK